jgi:hypothetical protein
MPPELKPLLAIVIALAIAHALLRARVRRSASARRVRTATKRAIAPIEGAEHVAPAANAALAALQRAVEERR